MLTFDEERHKYFYNGFEIAYVTQVLKPLQDFSMIDPKVLKMKAAWGTSIHRMVELDISGTLDINSLSDAQCNVLIQWHKFIDENRQWDIMGAITEYRMAHKRLLFAGTPDLYCPGQVLIDVKSRPYNAVVDPLQLAGYDLLVRDNFEEEAKKLPHIVLSLFEDRYTLNICKDRQASSKFRYMLDHYKKIQVWKAAK